MNRLLALLALLAPTLALAWPPGTTQEERLLLPPWCAYTQASWGTVEQPHIYDQYVKRYGVSWTHMHHYCWGLVSINRLNRLAVARDQVPNAIRVAKGEIAYVLPRTERGFPFRKEILWNLARLQLRENNAKDAETTARTLVADWPDHADGYALLAEILIRTGRKQEADVVLAKGDELVEDKDRYARLKSILPAR